MMFWFAFSRVLFATKGEIFGHWNCEWQYQWADLKEPPSVTTKGVQILLKVSTGQTRLQVVLSDD